MRCKERIKKVIAQSGYCSRRKAEELIKNGLVTVNGNTVREMGYKVSGNDYIEVEGNSIMEKQDKVYYLLNKPRGIITSTKDDKDRKTVVDLINENKRIYPVGRLDYDTTGLVILTNDGTIANLLMHPKNNIDKVFALRPGWLRAAILIRSVPVRIGLLISRTRQFFGVGSRRFPSVPT